MYKRQNSDVARFFVKKLNDKYNGVITVEYAKVKGHSNNPYNHKADRLAARDVYKRQAF